MKYDNYDGDAPALELARIEYLKQLVREESAPAVVPVQPDEASLNIAQAAVVAAALMAAAVLL
jgi:hypothetical protein